MSKRLFAFLRDGIFGFLFTRYFLNTNPLSSTSLQLIKWAVITELSSSFSGFELIKNDNIYTTDCGTSSDLLGPFFREGEPFRNIISSSQNDQQVPLKVVGKVFGADCKTALSDVLLNIWHCDDQEEYDMSTDDFICRGRISTDANGHYWYKTYIPPPYGGRPKHIHYMVHGNETHQKLVTQLYFKNDPRIDKSRELRYPYDDRRILEIRENEEGIAEVKLDLFLSAK